MSEPLRHALIRGIAAERVRAGLTQEELGRRLGWSRRSVQNMETGDREVQAHELVDICRALGITVDELLSGATNDDREVFAYPPRPRLRPSLKAVERLRRRGEPDEEVSDRDPEGSGDTGSLVQGDGSPAGLDVGDDAGGPAKA